MKPSKVNEQNTISGGVMGTPATTSSPSTIGNTDSYAEGDSRIPFSAGIQTRNGKTGKKKKKKKFNSIYEQVMRRFR